MKKLLKSVLYSRNRSNERTPALIDISNISYIFQKSQRQQIKKKQLNYANPQVRPVTQMYTCTRARASRRREKKFARLVAKKELFNYRPIHISPKRSRAMVPK